MKILLVISSKSTEIYLPVYNTFNHFSIPTDILMVRLYRYTIWKIGPWLHKTFLFYDKDEGDAPKSTFKIFPKPP